MNTDPVGNEAKNDELIIMLGNQWMQKNVGNRLKRATKYTAHLNKELANISFSNSNFDEIVELTYVKLMVYNSRRTGEMEGVRLVLIV